MVPEIAGRTYRDGESEVVSDRLLIEHAVLEGEVVDLYWVRHGESAT